MPYNANVLVLDSDTERGSELGRKLAMSGYSVNVFGSVAEAEPTMADGWFDTALIELEIKPDGSANIEATRANANRLKVNSKNTHLLTVIMGELPKDTDPAVLLSIGADEFLQRPIEDGMLLRCLSSFMRLGIMQAEYQRRLLTNSDFGIESEFDSESDSAVTIVTESTRVLVLGKDEAHIRTLEHILGDWMDFVCVWSPSAAIEQLNRSGYDACIVLADGDDINYTDFGQDLRRQSKLYHLPLLVLGSEELLGDGSEALGAGYNDVLAGPINGQLLFARVMALVAQEHYRQRLRKAYVDGKDARITDSISGLYSYGYFLTHLQREIAEATKYEKNLSIGYLSVSGMSAVNAEHGYPVGDYLIRQLGHLLTRLTRGEDLVARYVGDEFCVILPGTSSDRAQIVVKRLMNVIENTQFAIPGVMKAISISVMAAASGMETGESAEGFIDRVRAHAGSYSKTRATARRIG